MSTFILIQNITFFGTVFGVFNGFSEFFLMQQNTPSDQTNSKVTSYENFIENKLKKDLGEIETLLNKKADDHKNWQDLKNFVRHVQERNADELLIKHDIGYGVYMNAGVDDLKTIIVNVGCNCYLDMYYDEADKYVDIRMKYLKKEIDYLRQQAAHVKAHIKLTLLAIEELNH